MYILTGLIPGWTLIKSFTSDELIGNALDVTTKLHYQQVHQSNYVLCIPGMACGRSLKLGFMYPRNHTRASCTLLFSDTQIMKEWALGFVVHPREFTRDVLKLFDSFRALRAISSPAGFRALRPLESKVLCYRRMCQNDSCAVAVPNYASFILWSSCGYQRNSNFEVLTSVTSCWLVWQEGKFENTCVYSLLHRLWYLVSHV
jgi:hypothetical protein